MPHVIVEHRRMPIGLAGVENDPPELAQLARHRVRRAQGVPTVSVLVGEPNDAATLWRAWLTANGQTGTTSNKSTKREIVVEWLSGARVADRFAVAFIEAAARSLALSVGELRARIRGKGRPELECWVPQLASAAGCPASLAWLAVDPDRDPEVDQATLAESLVATARIVSLPPLLVRGPEPATSAWLAGAMGALVDLAVMLPQADLGIIVSDASFRAGEAGVARRVRATLAEGVVRVSPRQWAAGTSGAQRARSEAERQLYVRLQQRPRTRGLFTLNAVLSEHANAVPLEVDLLSERLRLAVEVDGYHHFREPEDYRRDRRKDLRLQQLGYVVLRVLAEDVVEEPDYVLQLIDDAIDRRSRVG